jgi:hypothetical protein
MRKIYFAEIAVLIVVVGVIPTEFMVIYGNSGGGGGAGSNNQNDNDPKNLACYNAGLADGRKNNPYSQKMFNRCGINGMAYYEGFLSGCISGQGKDYFSCQKLTNVPIGGAGGAGGSGQPGSNGSGGGGGGGHHH